MNNTNEEAIQTKLGVEVLVKYKDEILLVKRSPTLKYFANYLSLPGGHIDIGESLINAARRELLEETGIGISNDRLVLKYHRICYNHDTNILWDIPVFVLDFSEKPDIKSSNEGEVGWYTLGQIKNTLVVPTTFNLLNEMHKYDKSHIHFEYGEIINNSYLKKQSIN